MADHKDSVKAQLHTVNSVSHRYHYFIRQRDSRVIRGIVGGGNGEGKQRGVESWGGTIEWPQAEEQNFPSIMQSC